MNAHTTDQTATAADRFRGILAGYPGWDEDTNLCQLLDDFVAYCGEAGIDPAAQVRDAAGRCGRRETDG